ncbi:hypothetical protein BDZ89DRAFT_1189781 [Hymenopellis radicata]|nr:hypothetical protein BDZ89DRAFT_1189781 [Hymenopellis radicata]
MIGNWKNGLTSPLALRRIGSRIVSHLSVPTTTTPSQLPDFQRSELMTFYRCDNMRYRLAEDVIRTFTSNKSSRTARGFWVQRGRRFRSDNFQSSGKQYWCVAVQEKTEKCRLQQCPGFQRVAGSSAWVFVFRAADSPKFRGLVIQRKAEGESSADFTSNKPIELTIRSFRDATATESSRIESTSWFSVEEDVDHSDAE